MNAQITELDGPSCLILAGKVIIEEAYCAPNNDQHWIVRRARWPEPALGCATWRGRWYSTYAQAERAAMRLLAHLAQD